MARPLKPFIRGGGYYPSRRWTPLVYPGGYTTANGGGQPEPEAVLKTVTGSLIHITDALALPAEALSVNVEPIQDLHGYDSPWPAGGNYNKLSAASAFTQTDNGITLKSDGTGVYTLSGTATADFSYKFNIPEMIMPSTVYVHIMNSAGVSSSSAINLDFYNGATREDFVGFSTISNRKYNGTTVLGGKTINALQIRVTNGEAISGTLTFSPMVLLSNNTVPFSPYSNICPISGRTSATVTRTGKNLFSSNVTHGLWTGAGAYYSHEGSRSKYLTTEHKILVCGGETYCLSFEDDVSNAVASISFSAYKGNSSISSTYINVSTKTISVPSEADSITINFILTDAIMNLAEVSTTDFQLELGSTATTYEPYAGNTYTIQLGDTVYGGTLDVTGGKMVVDRAMVDLGTLIWNYLAPATSYPYGLLYATVALKKAGESNLLCSTYPLSTNFFRTDKTCIGNGRNGTFYVIDSTYSDAITFKTAISGAQLCYELATPFEITLTPTQINMLLGENNLWSDAGDSTLTYYAEGEASTSEALGILLGGTYNNPGGADDVSDDEALGILLGGS